MMAELYHYYYCIHIGQLKTTAWQRMGNKSQPERKEKRATPIFFSYCSTAFRISRPVAKSDLNFTLR
jgi:hypothetical protein